MKKGLKFSLILVVIALGIYGLNSVVNGADEESAAEMKERVQKAFDEAYMKGNVDALDEIYAPEYVMHYVMHYHDAPDIVGLDAYKEFTKWVRSGPAEHRVIIDEVMVSGDRGIFQWTFQGTLAAQRNEKWIFQNKETGESETIGVSIPAGTKYAQKGCTIVRLVNGKAVEAWEYSNSIVPTLTAAGIELKREPVE